MQITKKFMNWYHGENDLEKAPPKSGIRRVGYILVNYTGKLIAINMLFVLCCLPVFTIPAALTALNRYLIKLFRTGYGFSTDDFFHEFKCNLLKSIPLGVVTGGLLLYAYYLFSLSGNYELNFMGSLIQGIGIAIFFITAVFGAYTFLLLAMLDLSVGSIFRNVMILIMVEWPTSLLTAATLFAFWFLILAFAPYTFAIMLLIGFSLQQLLICALLNPVVNRRIIGPYEKKNQIDDINNQC